MRSLELRRPVIQLATENEMRSILLSFRPLLLALVCVLFAACHAAEPAADGGSAELVATTSTRPMSTPAP